MVKLISFDLNGTLLTYNLENDLLKNKIPRLYAQKQSTSFDEASQKCREIYYEYQLINGTVNWEKMPKVLEELGIDEKNISFDKGKGFYSDVLPALKQLKDYNLVVFTDASQNFVEREIQNTKYEKYFEELISSPSKLGTGKVNPNAFKKLANHLGVEPKQILHIGDSKSTDYSSAKRAGCKALLLDRSGKEGIKNLKEINDFI